MFCYGSGPERMFNPKRFLTLFSSPQTSPFTQDGRPTDVRHLYDHRTHFHAPHTYRTRLADEPR